MPGKQAEVSYSVIPPEALKSELISKYGFDESITCVLYRNGMNDIYQVTVGETVYYLRIAFNRAYDITDYREETAIMLALNESGVKTAVPVKCNSGDYVWPLCVPEGTKYITLFTEAKNQPSQDSAKINFNLGQAVAKIHTISDEQSFNVSRSPIDFTELIHKPMQSLQPYLEKQCPEDYRLIASAMEDIEKYIAARLSTEKPCYGFCHGDIHLGNVFFSGDAPTFFDFDTMGYGWRAHDISVNMFNMEMINPQYRDGDDYNAFLDGYSSVRILSENELSCIDMFGAIRPIWALDINVRLLEMRNLSVHLNECINIFIKVFKYWHNKYIINRQER